MGTELATDRLLSMVRADGYEPGCIRLAFITRPHADHAGGAHSIREATGAAIAAAAKAAVFLRNADEHRFNLDSARAAGRYPADYRLTACDVEHELSDGQDVPVGRLQVCAIRTPRHSAGGLRFWIQGQQRAYLFTGDTLFFGGKVL